MKKLFAIIAIAGVIVMLNPVQISARTSREKSRQDVLNRSRDYYKDILMDSGIGVTSRRILPASDSLNLKMEYFEGPYKESDATVEDKAYQASVIYGSEEDTNGWLLYPDGAPRFRMIYVNGGNARVHASSFSKEGLNRICEYVRNGGSYVGTCAGAFFGSAGGYDRVKNKTRYTNLYIGIWPGYTHSTGVKKSQTSLTIPKRSPLLRFYDFGDDNEVKEVNHNGGCYAYDGKIKPMPKGTEILARYRFDDNEQIQIDGRASIWGYKVKANCGRVILCGSHPEKAIDGERLDLMASMILYAMDGNPAPQPKGVLQSGQVREMNKRSEDNNPAYTRIGDKQYHHFVVNVPRKCKQLKINLSGYENESEYDLVLCANQGELAYKDNASHKVVEKGCNKTLIIEKPKTGKWYISVLCDTTVEIGTGKNGTTYISNRGVLNGVPYKVSVEY